MYRKLVAAAIPALLFTVGAAAARDNGPYLDSDGPRAYRAAPDGVGIYVQDNRLRWYYATFFTRCINLPGALTIGFKTAHGRLERGSTVFAEGRACRIASIDRSAPPPGEPGSEAEPES
jgi:hypothetical protein